MAKSIDLTGKTAVITGAGSGIGRATARLLARHGAKVHIADLNGEAAAAAAREIGGSATHHAVDVTRPEDLAALAETIFAADGRRRHPAQQRRHRPRRRRRGHDGRGLAAGDRGEPARRRLWRAGVRAADARTGPVGRSSSTPPRKPGLSPIARDGALLRLQVRRRRHERGAQRRVAIARHPRRGDLPGHHQHTDRARRDHAWRASAPTRRRSLPSTPSTAPRLTRRSGGARRDRTAAARRHRRRDRTSWPPTCCTASPPG